METNVVELCTKASGFAVDQLFAWARDWIDALERGDYGDIVSLVFVVERADGEVATISQSLSRLDAVRMLGLLSLVAHRKLDGRADIEGLLHERT